VTDKITITHSPPKNGAHVGRVAEIAINGTPVKRAHVNEIKLDVLSSIYSVTITFPVTALEIVQLAEQAETIEN